MHSRHPQRVHSAPTAPPSAAPLRAGTAARLLAPALVKAILEQQDDSEFLLQGTLALVSVMKLPQHMHASTARAGVLAAQLVAELAAEPDAQAQREKDRWQVDLAACSGFLEATPQLLSRVRVRPVWAANHLW